MAVQVQVDDARRRAFKGLLLRRREKRWQTGKQAYVQIEYACVSFPGGGPSRPVRGDDRRVSWRRIISLPSAGPILLFFIYKNWDKNTRARIISTWTMDRIDGLVRTDQCQARVHVLLPIPSYPSLDCPTMSAACLDLVLAFSPHIRPYLVV